MTPTVSIMVPVFNRADLLPACLDSALAQTMPDLEVVLVDGASTDGTWDICLEYAARDPRVRAIREDANSGPVEGWVRCLAEARGTYATFLWSDDVHFPRFLEATLPSLQSADVGFVFTAAEIGPVPGSGTVHYARKAGRGTSNAFIRTSLKDPGRLPVSPACALFRLEDLRASLTPELPTNPPVDLRWTGAGTDVLFYLRTAQRYPSVECVTEAHAFFRAHPGSITAHGRGGAVRLHYALARAWFASTSHRRRAVELVLARHWMSDMSARRRLVLPWAAARRYVGLISPWRLLRAGVRIKARQAAFRIRAGRAPR